jgi:hypothetical protein
VPTEEFVPSVSENKKSVGKIDPTKGDSLGNILWVSER